MTAPMASIPLRWRSIGREPIAHPPGIATLARPKRASNGPNTTIEARILDTYLKGASYESCLVASKIIVLFTSSIPTSTFKKRITLFIVYTSDKTGTLYRVVRPSSGMMHAAKIGKTAFLAPSISTVPTRRFPPRTIIFSTFISSTNDYSKILE